jgi:acid phosphatase family membrane protein YuiD
MFAIAAVMAIVVMYDACNVRRRSGEQAQAINLILQNWTEVTPELLDLQVKVLLGHTPVQVFFGAILGCVISIVFNLVLLP